MPVLTRGLVRHIYPPSPRLGRTDPLDQGLIAEWRFDKPTGLILKDATGRGYSGTLTGVDAKWTMTDVGPVFHADNTGAALTAWVDFDTDVDLLGSGSQAWSLEFFVYATDLSGSANINAILGLMTGGTNGFWVIGCDLASYRPLAFGAGNGDPFTEIVDNDNVAHPINRWVHWMITYNGAGGGVIGNYALYQDGASKATAAAGAFPGGNQSCSFGRRGADATQPWHGYIALVRIYHRALSAGEARARHQRVLQRRQELDGVWIMPQGKAPAAGPTLSISVTPSDFDYWKQGVKVVG